MLENFPTNFFLPKVFINLSIALEWLCARCLIRALLPFCVHQNFFLAPGIRTQNTQEWRLLYAFACYEYQIKSFVNRPS